MLGVHSGLAGWLERHGRGDEAAQDWSEAVTTGEIHAHPGLVNWLGDRGRQEAAAADRR